MHKSGCSMTPTRVAIPLGQGQVFNEAPVFKEWSALVAIPLGQGQVFNLI